MFLILLFSTITLCIQSRRISKNKNWSPRWNSLTSLTILLGLFVVCGVIVTVKREIDAAHVSHVLCVCSLCICPIQIKRDSFYSFPFLSEIISNYVHFDSAKWPKGGLHSFICCHNEYIENNRR